MAELLRDIEKFLLVHPPAEWKTRSDDTPLRTMKTILHTLVKIMGPDVLKQLSLVGKNPVDSTSGAYLLVMLDKSGLSPDALKALIPTSDRCLDVYSAATVVMRASPRASSSLAAPVQSSARPDSMADFASVEAMVGSQRAHTESSISEDESPALSAIFAKISSRDNMRFGIQELYAYQKAHAGVDISALMGKLSAPIQKYVQRSLSDLEEENARKSQFGAPTKPAAAAAAPSVSYTAPSPSPARPSGLPVSSATAQQYMERLKQLQSRAPLATMSAQQPEPVSVSVAAPSILEVDSPVITPVK